MKILLTLFLSFFQIYAFAQSIEEPLEKSYKKYTKYNKWYKENIRSKKKIYYDGSKLFIKFHELLRKIEHSLKIEDPVLLSDKPLGSIFELTFMGNENFETKVERLNKELESIDHSIFEEIAFPSIPPNLDKLSYLQLNNLIKNNFMERLRTANVSNEFIDEVLYDYKEIRVDMEERKIMSLQVSKVFYQLIALDKIRIPKNVNAFFSHYFTLLWWDTQEVYPKLFQKLVNTIENKTKDLEGIKQNNKQKTRDYAIQIKRVLELQSKEIIKIEKDIESLKNNLEKRKTNLDNEIKWIETNLKAKLTGLLSKKDKLEKDIKTCEENIKNFQRSIRDYKANINYLNSNDYKKNYKSCLNGKTFDECTNPEHQKYKDEFIAQKNRRVAEINRSIIDLENRIISCDKLIQKEQQELNIVKTELEKLQKEIDNRKREYEVNLAKFEADTKKFLESLWFYFFNVAKTENEIHLREVELYIK